MHISVTVMSKDTMNIKLRIIYIFFSV